MWERRTVLYSNNISEDYPVPGYNGTSVITLPPVVASANGFIVSHCRYTFPSANGYTILRVLANGGTVVLEGSESGVIEYNTVFPVKKGDQITIGQNATDNYPLIKGSSSIFIHLYS